MLSKAGIQRLRSLREKKNREEAGLFVVEGEKVVRELVVAGFAFEELFATSEWMIENKALFDDRPSGALPASTFLPRDGSNAAPHIHEITIEEMARASHYPTPSSVLAVGKIVRRTLATGDIDRGLTLALDGVQDPGNVGTLLRIADWFGLDRVILSPDCADLFHQKVINASMGSFARVSTYTVALSTALLQANVPVLGCDLEGNSVHCLPALRDAVIIIGSEGRGLSGDAKSLVTELITIPRFGNAESLNAATAAAIVCDNLRRMGI
jgi:TrmH family RNA methyltransferase